MITYHPDIIQGSDEWLAARCGLLGAGSMSLILTPTLKVASNEKEHAHVYEIAAQRITRYVEPTYIGDDMLRGMEDEIIARDLYSERFALIDQVGHVTNDRWGFTIGYSPDGLVGDDGLIEIKSRRQRFQIETIVKAVPDQIVPIDYLLQIQTGLLVTERAWLDFISYSGGLPMAVIRCYPDKAVQDAIVAAATAFEERVAAVIEKYHATVKGSRMIPTERRVVQEMFA